MAKTRNAATAPADVLPRRTKILCTMGPAMDDPAILEKVFLAGANAFRVNFSHGDHAQHGRYLNLIRSVARKLDRPAAVLADLMGPKVRVDTREYQLQPGTEVWLVPQPGNPEKGEIGISFGNLAPLVKPGQRLLLDDGQLELAALGKSGKRIRCMVARGGLLKPRKTLNVPGVDLGLPVLSRKDKDDLRYIAKAGFDWVASSFIRHGEDVRTVKRYMRSVGFEAPVVAKVESAQAIGNLRGIIAEAEGVMVARGDMGVELDLELIPTIQRNIIHLAREMGKVTIIATQMMESMTNSPRPTRAEVTDVSAAALSRVDVVMLSGETAAGRYPAETVRMMDRTIRTTERNLEEEIVGISHPEPIAATCEAGLYLSLISGAKAVVLVSTYGNSPRILSTYRGNIPVVVGCTRADIYNRSTLYYSVQPIMVSAASNTETMFKRMEADLKGMGLVKKGDVVVLVFGHPIHARNNTNTIRRWEVG
jgi:pyruvate kinase